MEGHKAFSQQDALLNGAYLNSVAVQKILAGSRKLIFADRDKSLQPDPQPVANPSRKDLQAGIEFRQLSEKCVFIESTAQVLERAVDKETFTLSVLHGLTDRAPPRIRMPDGRITDDPGEVLEWVFLNNPDMFLGFGTGTYLRQLGGWYALDKEQWDAMGGASWRPKLFRDLSAMFPDKSYLKFLSFIDQPGRYKKGDPHVDVKELALRAERWDWSHLERLKFMAGVITGKAEGLFKNVEMIDETKGEKLVTYLIAPGAQKDELIEGAATQLSVSSGVPLEEFDTVIIDDAPPGLKAGLKCLKKARKVDFIVPAGSVIGPGIRKNEDLLAGVPLVGSPNHPEMPGYYHPSPEMPGLYEWESKEDGSRRRVWVADETPWCDGMGCTQSVLELAKRIEFFK